jgi:uncharacterized glyoxalase superfamily protein PhnB
VFQALADDHAAAATLWGKPWGMLKDNFRTPWIIKGERVPF